MPDLMVAPALLAALAALLFGAQALFAKRGLAYVDPQAGAMITIGTTAAVFWLLSPLLLRAEYWTSPGLWVFMINGMMHPLMSMYLSFEANQRMGPTVSATISATTPLFATAGAVAALGETVTLAILIGTLCTVVGIMALTWTPSGKARAWALSALAFPIGAALVRAVNQVLGKYGLGYLPSPYFAGLISFTVSITGSILIYRLRNGRLPLRLPRQALRWNGWGGLCIAGAILCMYSALNGGKVVVVAPIVSAYPLSTVFLAMLFRQEAVGPRTLAGVLLVIGGVVWISLQ